MARRRGERGPDKGRRKGSPLAGKRLETPATPRQQKPGDVRRAKMLELLATGKTPYIVAAELGVNVATIYKWVKLPEIADELARREEAMRESARRTMQASAVAVAEELVRIATGFEEDEDLDELGADGRPLTRRRAVRVDPSRVQAARAILDRIGLGASQTVQLGGGMEITFPDLRQLTPEQLAALAAEDKR